MSSPQEKEVVSQFLAEGDHIDAPPLSIYTGYFNGSFDTGKFYVDLGAPLAVNAKVIVQLCPVWLDGNPAKIKTSKATIDIGQRYLEVTYGIDHPDKLTQLIYTVFIKFGS